MSDVLVLGGGAWGRALAAQAVRAGRSVSLCTRDLSRAYPAGVSVVAVPEWAAVVLVCVPVSSLHALPRGEGRGEELGTHPLWTGPSPRPSPKGKDAVFVACCKGMDAGGRLPSELLGPETAVLSGPNFAAEILAGLPAAAVVAARDPGTRATIIAALGTERFRLYGQDDVIGVQVCGAAKNVIAIAAGIVFGAGLGENARAALITRGLAEIARLSAALGGRAETVMGLAGLGDLLLTATGPQSRNFSLGARIGAGASPDAALAGSAGVAEGVTTAPAIVRRAREVGVELPVCAAVADILAGRVTPDAAAASLLARKLRDE